MNMDELVNIQNEIINAQENLIRTGEDIIKAYEVLTALLQEKEAMRK